MNPLYLAGSFVFGLVLGGPVWLLTAALIAAARDRLTILRRRTVRAARLTVLAVKAGRAAIREDGVRETAAHLREPHTGKHTPRPGTRIPTERQIAAATPNRQLEGQAA